MAATLFEDLPEPRLSREVLALEPRFFGLFRGGSRPEPVRGLPRFVRGIAHNLVFRTPFVQRGVHVSE
jgi:hypothetical protein